MSNAENHSHPLDTEAKPLFDAAFRAHHASLVNYLRRRVDCDADAHDIAQEAYVCLFRYRENRDLSSLKALVFRIATNIVGMRARTARVQRRGDHETLVEGLEIPASDPLPEQQLLGDQQLDRLMDVIQRLPPKSREVFVLSRFHDLSYAEIAFRCGIAIKTVEKHIAAALSICRREVGGNLP